MQKRRIILSALIVALALVVGSGFFVKGRINNVAAEEAKALEAVLAAEADRLNAETGLALVPELLAEEDENGCPKAVLKLDGKEVGLLELEKIGGNAFEPAAYSIKNARSTVSLNVLMGQECVLSDGSKEYSYESGEEQPVCKLTELACKLSAQSDAPYITRQVKIDGLYDISQLSGSIRGKTVKFLLLEEENTYFATLEMTAPDKESARAKAAELLAKKSSGQIEALKVSDPVFLMHCCAIVDCEFTLSGTDFQKSFLLSLDKDGFWQQDAEYDNLSFEATAPRTEQRTYIDPNKKINGKMPYCIKVNRLQNCTTVYTLDEAGEYTVPVRAMVCSTGREGHETPLGDFSISSFKPKWCYMEDGSYGQYVSKFRSDGYLFHTICYHKKDPSTMMVNEYNMLGGYASLGCVRLQTFDAIWVYYNCQPGTPVIIYEDENPGPLGKPFTFIEEITPEMDNGWDPTDPRPDNPWRYINL